MIIPHKLFHLQISSLNILIGILIGMITFSLSSLLSSPMSPAIVAFRSFGSSSRQPRSRERPFMMRITIMMKMLMRVPFLKLPFFHFPLKIFDSGVFEATFCSQITFGLLRRGRKWSTLAKFCRGEKITDQKGALFKLLIIFVVKSMQRSQ